MLILGPFWPIILTHNPHYHYHLPLMVWNHVIKFYKINQLTLVLKLLHKNQVSTDDDDNHKAITLYDCKFFAFV